MFLDEKRFGEPPVEREPSPDVGWRMYVSIGLSIATVMLSCISLTLGNSVPGQYVLLVDVGTFFGALTLVGLGISSLATFGGPR